MKFQPVLYRSVENIYTSSGDIYTTLWPRLCQEDNGSFAESNIKRYSYICTIRCRKEEVEIKL